VLPELQKISIPPWKGFCLRPHPSSNSNSASYISLYIFWCYRAPHPEEHPISSVGEGGGGGGRGEGVHVCLFSGTAQLQNLRLE